MKKGFFRIVLVSFSILLLAGCGQKAANSSNTGNSRSRSENDAVDGSGGAADKSDAPGGGNGGSGDAADNPDAPGGDNGGSGDAADNPEISSEEPKYANPDNLKSISEPVEFNGVAYTINSVEFSKSLGGRDMSIMNYYDEEHDGDGTLLGNETYIILNMTIQNNSDGAVEELVNWPIVSIDKNDYEIRQTQAAEGRYVWPWQEGHTLSNGHHFILEPGASANFEEIYIIYDNELGDSLYFSLGDVGSDSDSARNKFISLGNPSGGDAK